MNQISDIGILHTPQLDDDVTIKFHDHFIIGFSFKGIYRWESASLFLNGSKGQIPIIGVDLL